jgi:hypothetical protein
MLQVLPVLGIEAFVQVASKVESEAEREMLTCKIKNVVASGYLTPNGIVVLSKSEAVLEERSSAKKWPSVMTQRNRLIEEGGLIQKGDKYVFKKDTEFSSPSSAAAVIHGGSANGLTAWVDNNGKSLKELQNIS